VADRGVAFPIDYQKALVEDIAREISLIFKTVIIVRLGDTPPFGHAVLRISGTAIRFKNSAQRRLLRLSGGTATVQAQVRFADASTGQVLLVREVKGNPDSVGKKVAELCNSMGLVDSQ
jgi:hypothetical protein